MKASLSAVVKARSTDHDLHNIMLFLVSDRVRD